MANQLNMQKSRDCHRIIGQQQISNPGNFVRRQLSDGKFTLVSKEPVIKGYWSHEGLLRILENLCNNAVKYGRDHSPITVTLDKQGDEVSLSVHNFGNPIQPQELAKLFTPYQRNEKDKDAIKGWGLGLTLVKGLTESHRGRVNLESNMDQGTTFTVTIPQDSRMAPING